MSKFKVGDRVKTSGWYSFDPNEGTVAATGDSGDVYFVAVDNENNPVGDKGWAYNAPMLSPAAATPATAAMTIQAGKFYKARDGRKVGPMVKRAEYGDFIVKSGDGYLWLANGSGNSKDDDLIAEWVADPVVVAAKATTTFKVGDKVVYNGGGFNAARAGATATVAGVTDEYLDLRWTRDGLDERQMDGNYLPSHFTLAPPAIPTIGDWVRDQEGRIGIVFHDDGDDRDNLYVGWTDDGDWETVGAKYLTIVPPGTKEAAPKPEPTPANDNYEIGDIVEIADTCIFGESVNVGDLASVIRADGDIWLRVQAGGVPLSQVVYRENLDAIRPYRRTT